METLVRTLMENVKAANDALKVEDYATARSHLLRAAECTLLLSKNSTGATKDKYIKQYGELKTLLESVDKKLASAKPAPSTAAKPVASAPAPTKPEQKPKYTNTTDLLRPQWLSDYIGQPQAVTAVRDLIDAALLKHSAMPHIILYGSHGLGKSTFSKIIANELHAGFVEINGSKITSDDLITILQGIKPRDVVFIDEIHTLPLSIAESVLYSAMQDGRITYTEGKGKNAQAKVVELPPFTLIGATTEIGKLAKPLIQRAIQIRLVEYSDEVLGRIIEKSFYRLGTAISSDDALYVAKRCRNNPRVANSIVSRISDKALVRYAQQNNLKKDGLFSSAEAIRKLNVTATRNVIDEFFDENGIDQYGLENSDRQLLQIIITRYNGGPVGLDTLSKVMNESNNVIAQKYESYLIKKGMLRIDREGRVAMPKAYEVLGLPLPQSENQPADPAQESPKYERRKIVASQVQDEIKCQKVQDLITYPEDAQAVSQNLDELFPDVVKPYDDETKHSCQLVIDFDTHKRTIVCDSFLESRFATMLATVGYVQDLKAQSLEIPYISQALANHRYFPDFILKDYLGRIAIVETKNYSMASYHLNLDKYEMLQKYCTEHGYGYAEIMKANNAETYVSLSMLASRPTNGQLKEAILQAVQTNGCFTQQDWQTYVQQYQTDIADVYTILINDRSLKNIDRSGENLNIVSA